MQVGEVEAAARGVLSYWRRPGVFPPLPPPLPPPFFSYLPSVAKPIFLSFFFFLMYWNFYSFYFLFFSVFSLSHSSYHDVNYYEENAPPFFFF